MSRAKPYLEEIPALVRIPQGQVCSGHQGFALNISPAVPVHIGSKEHPAQTRHIYNILEGLAISRHEMTDEHAPVGRLVARVPREQQQALHRQ